MHCSRCSTENPTRAKFCLECGAPLAETATACPPAGRPAEAERRQLTCLSCDLVNSVELSARLDPEELRETLAAYRRVCAAVVRRFDGHVHDYSGDGIMVYFGFPSAHEDDAQRAVRSGLGIVEAVGQLNSRLESDRGIGLHVRIGIDTGLVVAGGTGADEGLEATAAVGATPNIAARLQSLAAPDSVVISAAAYRLIAGLFDCRELGFRTVRGISQPMAIYQVLHESAARTRLDVAAQRGLAPMQGRDGELRRLTERWAQARAGHGSVALVVGEPGIGKSRLIRSLQEHVAQSPDVYFIPLACSPYYRNTAFHPVVQYLQRLLQFAPEDTVDQRLDKVDGLATQYGFDLPSRGPLLAELLGVPFEGRYARLEMPADQQRQLTIDTLVEGWLLRARRQPVLFVVEDLHWADPSTLDFLTQLIDRVPESRQLIVLSARPDLTPPWPDGPGLDRLELDRLDPEASGRVVTETAGAPVPERLRRQVVAKADGVPLYLEELTKLVVEQGLVGHGNGRFDPAGSPENLAVPATLADSLRARLDRLPDAKGVAQLGAVIGRQFPYELICAVAETITGIDSESLRYQLARLTDAGLLFVECDARGETYTFKHALIQDAAYASLLLTTRRKHHRRIAQVLAERFPATVETAPELLAHHYTEAGLTAEAVPHWLRSGERALHGSANPEAIAHLSTGLRLLTGLPAGQERAAQELRFHLALGPACMAVHGYASPEVEACYRRAQELCEELGDAPHLVPVPKVVPVLHGLWTSRVVRTQHADALAIGEQVLELGAATDDDGAVVQGNMEVGWSHFFLGHLQQAREHLERVLALYDHERHGAHTFIYGDNPATSARSNLAQALWLLGYTDQSLQVSDENVTTLRSSFDHVHSIAFGLDLAAVVRQYRRDAPATRLLVDDALSLSEAHDLAFFAAMASILKGWVLTEEGDLEEGLAQMRRGLAAHVSTGAELAKPYWLCLIAEACGRTGAAHDGLELLDEAETVVEQSDERYWEAEIHRLRGDLLLAAGPSSEDVTRTVERHYLRALEIARRQGARSLELRAAVSLSRLWEANGRRDQARGLLAPVYGWFSEGLDTPDLREAAALLADLDAEYAISATGIS
ncbi:adenylate/guanylate cyclase domain-containing protein [Geodermatophilus maliterrae]|uniref:AAA family ATPase n=1 Tax=Geodermatophilus maliterrae TaxID=3162531 RepID=A0ABV3XKF9_9ACTN